MLTFIAITFVIAWAFQTWRKHVWKRRFALAMSPHVKLYVSEFAKIWAEGYRDAQRTSDWPEEIVRRDEA